MTGRELVRQNLRSVVSTIQSDDFRSKLGQALPEGVTVDRFVRTASTALQMNPDMAAGRGDGYLNSLYNSLIRAAQDGLLPDGREAALVKFSSKKDGRYVDACQYLPMIGGLRKVAAKNRVTLIAYVVYENDDFEYRLGLEPTVRHVPPALNEPRGAAIGAYAVATDSAGLKYLEVMSRDEIEKVKSVSRAKDSEYGPWVNWWEEMARKTVARRLFKQLPLGDLDDTSRRILQQADADSVYAPEPAVAELPRVDGDPDGWTAGDAEPDVIDADVIDGGAVEVTSPDGNQGTDAATEEAGGGQQGEPAGVHAEADDAGSSPDSDEQFSFEGRAEQAQSRRRTRRETAE